MKNILSIGVALLALAGLAREKPGFVKVADRSGGGKGGDKVEFKVR